MNTENFHEVYNVEKWDLENVEHGKHVEIQNFQMWRLGLFCTSGDGLLEVTQLVEFHYIFIRMYSTNSHWNWVMHASVSGLYHCLKQ